MGYGWSNRKRLSSLDVAGDDSVLVFETGKERAEVYLENGDIARVLVHVSGTLSIIHNSQRHHIVVGEGNTGRDVYHYLKPGGPAPYLRLGITRHSNYGTWSSLPHPFELNPEPGFEEVFFHMLEGSTKRAIQVGRGLWWDGTPVDEVWSVADHTFSTIPMGYHPVVGEPGVRVSYVWAYLAKKKEWEKI